MTVYGLAADCFGGVVDEIGEGFGESGGEFVERGYDVWVVFVGVPGQKTGREVKGDGFVEAEANGSQVVVTVDPVFVVLLPDWNACFVQ